MKTLRTQTVRWVLVAVLVAAGLGMGGCFKMNVNVPDIPDPNVYINDGGSPPQDVPPRHDDTPPRESSRGAHTGGYDSLAQPGRPVLLAGWLADANGKGVSGAALRFYVGGQLLAEALTDNAGLATAPWTPTEAGGYRVTVKVLRAPEAYGPDVAHARPGEFVVSCLDPRDQIVVVDLDDCVFESMAKRTWLGSDRANPGSVAALSQIGQRFPLVYLTRRPDVASTRTHQWLDRQGFPQGPILRDGPLPPVSDAAALKTARLANLAATFPALHALVTERRSDAQAFAARGAAAYLFVDIDPKEDDPDDLRDQANELRRLGPRVNAVTSWDQVQTGLLTGRAYPATDLARQLDAKARRLRRHDH